MQRHNFQRDKLKLSYLDAVGNGRPLVALHAHWMEGQTYAPLAEALAPDWRVIALDQRGHGYSDHAATYTREDYLGDLDALFTQLELQKAVLLGNSLGGVNAYQFAARHPHRVLGLVIEDIGAEIADDTSFALPWGGAFKTREALEERVGARFVPYLKDSFRETPEGWRLAFDPRETLGSQLSLNGNHWNDWEASNCPALLLRGADSRVTKPAHIEEMASRRPNTKVVTLKGGHVLHFDDPEVFAKTVRIFLQEL
jgi:esterase